MNKIELKDTTLTVFTQSATEVPATPIPGTLTCTEGEIVFVQTVAKPRVPASQKLFDGECFSISLNRKGELILYTKGMNLLAVANMKAFQTQVTKELKAVAEIVNKLKSQNA